MVAVSTIRGVVGELGEQGARLTKAGPLDRCPMEI